MTKLFLRAMIKAQQLPPEVQDESARFVLTYAGEDERPAAGLTREDEEAIAASEAAAARGEFATDKEVRAIWAKHGL